jgi:hypothetical protein
MLQQKRAADFFHQISNQFFVLEKNNIKPILVFSKYDQKKTPNVFPEKFSIL